MNAQGLFHFYNPPLEHSASIQIYGRNLPFKFREGGDSMNTILRSVTTTLAVATTLATAIIVSSATMAQADTLNYTVLRDGKPIGTHAVTIDQNGAETQVAIETDIAVKVFFVTAYKFKHTSQESWSNGQLVAITSTTDDDGIAKELNARAESGRLTVDSTIKGNERRQNADANAFPASLWNAATVKQSALLNTLDGEVMTVAVEDLGTENVDAGGTSIQAKHYAITGELTRELWFDATNRLVRMSFPDKTNTKITYALN